MSLQPDANAIVSSNSTAAQVETADARVPTRTHRSLAFAAISNFFLFVLGVCRFTAVARQFQTSSSYWIKLEVYIQDAKLYSMFSRSAGRLFRRPRRRVDSGCGWMSHRLILTSVASARKIAQSCSEPCRAKSVRAAVATAPSPSLISSTVAEARHAHPGR